MQPTGRHHFYIIDMQFHAEFSPKEFENKISLGDKIMLLGSCFTEQIGQKLSDHKFDTLQNPNGILFNPVSIEKALYSYISSKLYSEQDLFYFNERWQSWNHHSRFSRTAKDDTLKAINASTQAASLFLKHADWLIITMGSAFTYQRREIETRYEAVVANCHKVPNDKFNRVLLLTSEVEEILTDLINKVKKYNQNIRIIFTISPVRHLREGFIENNRSKASLIQAVHSVTNDNDILYFPSYELVIDDLRDYRFYAEDMVHPNYAATNYVWEKFINTCISAESREIMKEIAQIRSAVNHKPFNPISEEHGKFKATHIRKILLLEERYPFLDFTIEKEFLSD